jgi:hypothetical protein
MRANIDDGHYDVTIMDAGQWRSVAPGTDAIVDPMVFRTADVFLSGATGSDNDSQLWIALSQNVASLVAFFDILIYSRQLPLIDYGMTFATPEGYTVSRLYHMVNETQAEIPGNEPQPLLSVHIDGTAHQNARNEALKKLKLHGPVDPAMTALVDGELSAFDHAWRPDLTEIDPRYTWTYDSPQRRVETFIYGGLLFGYLADAAGLPHLLQGTRAELEEAVALQVAPSQFEDDALLNKTLGSMLEARLAAAGVMTPTSRGIPPVLPYLLSHYQPQSPRELIRRALELRGTSMMQDFRDWKNSCAENFRKTFTIRPDDERDVIAVADAIQARLSSASQNSTFTFKFVPVPNASQDLLAQDLLWNWTLSSVPECNHVKMLYHLQVADRGMAFVDRDKSLQLQMQAIWRKSTS